MKLAALLLCLWTVTAWGTNLPQGTLESAKLDKLAGTGSLIKRSYRPPNYETPADAFKQEVTPNDRFFVRYHLSANPEIKAADWKLEVAGEASEHPLRLTLDQLKKDFPAVEVTAVALCAGNRRGLFEPHVPGVQWSSGAMGNARWKGARLKDVLAKAGIRKDAVEILFDGADTAQLGKDPGPYSFRKFTSSFVPSRKGAIAVVARATNQAGAAQPLEATPNPAGYHHNAILSVQVVVE